MRSWIAGALLVAGCATVQTTGTRRNPSFREAALPAPMLLWDTASCLATGDSTGTISPDSPIDVRLRSQLGADHASPNLATVDATCAALAPNEIFLDDVVLGTRWTIPEALQERLRDSAATHGASTVLVPVLRFHSACRQTNPYFKERDPAIATRGPPGECGDDPSQDLGLFAFDAHGQLLWKTTGTNAEGTRAALEPVLNQLVAQVPVTPGPAGTAVAEPVP